MCVSITTHGRLKTRFAMNNHLYDCIVIGAGPAGLSASLFLARYRRRTLTFHHNSPRNEYAHGIHGLLGHHGIPPAEFLARGRDEVTAHGGLIVESCVTGIEQLSNDHFRIRTGNGDEEHRTFEARRSEEHTSELQSQSNLVCRLLLEKKKKKTKIKTKTIPP